MKIIKSIGVELEGGFYKEKLPYFKKKYRKRFSHKTDGSVWVDGFDIHDGEFLFWSHRPKKVLQFVKEMFAAGFQQNKSCGNHIHIQFSEEVIGFLSFNYARESFVKEWRRFIYAPKTQELGLTRRLLDREDNRYCILDPDEEVAASQLENEYHDSSRYNFINYNALKKIPPTVEIRILPYALNYTEYEYMFLWLLKTCKRIIYQIIQKEVPIGVRRVNFFRDIVRKYDLVTCHQVLNQKEIIKNEVEVK